MNTTSKGDALTENIIIDEQAVRIRPITLADLTREKQFVEALSPLSRHYRFLGGVGHLSEEALKQFCDINYTDNMAFIATILQNGEEQEIGVSRYAKDNNNGCEFAVTVADDWQHRGLGRLLMDKLIDFARDGGIESIYSLDFADNSHMRMLARDLGMKATRDEEDAALVRNELQL